MLAEKEDEENDRRYLPLVVIPDSVVFRPPGTGSTTSTTTSTTSTVAAQLMVAMQPGVEVQEVVVVTDHRDHHGYYDHHDDHEEDAPQMKEEDEMGVDYEEGSEVVAAEIEVVDARSFEEFLMNGVRSRNERLRVKHGRKGRWKRKTGGGSGGGRFGKRSSVKMLTTMSRKRVMESSPEFDDSESDAMEETGYGRSSHKPRKRDFAHRLQWRDADMQAAMSAVREKNTTIRGAAKQFNVPYSTLKDRVRNRVKHGTKPGVKTALSPEDEEELVRCIQQMESAGFQMHGMNIREQAHELLNRNQHCGANSKHRTTAPGHNWLAGFLKRHPGIEIKRSINRPVTPSFSKQKHMTKKFFDAAQSAYQKLYMSPQPTQLYTMTEFKLSSFPYTSIIVAAAANGAVLPPYILFNGSRILMRGLQQYFPTAFFAVYSSGSQRKDILFSWFRDHFLHHAHQKSLGRPVILFVGQPACNISVHFVQLANDRQVSLVSIPTGIAHLVQPLNDVVVREIDDLVTKRGRKYLEDRKTPSIDQVGMAEILQKVWQRGLPSKDIVSNFKENGLFPFNMRAVTHERITSSTPMVDALKEEEFSSENETNGLALLSELSSLEHGDQSFSDTKNFDFNRKRAYDGADEMSPFKQRQKLSAVKLDFEQKVPVERTSPEACTPRLSEELMKHVLANDKKEASCSRTRPSHPADRRRRQNVRQEILDSKTNPEQLELAIRSIVDEPSKASGSRSQSNLRTFRISPAIYNSPGRKSVRQTYKSESSSGRVLMADVSKFVTLTPIHHIVEVSPNVKQEYISYVEDPLTIQEEFVPQEIVEEQTVVHDCASYEMPSDAFSKEQVVEEFTEEVVDLPEFILATGEVIGADSIKIENVDHEFLNNNELNYDLQAESGNVDVGGDQSRLSVKMLNIAEIGADLSPNNPDTTMYIEVNGRSYPVVQTLSVQEFRKTFGYVSQTAGLLLGDEGDGVDEEMLFKEEN